MVWLVEDPVAVFIISACDRWLRGGWVMQADSVNRFAIRGSAVFAIDSSVLAAALVSNCEHRTVCCGLEPVFRRRFGCRNFAQRGQETSATATGPRTDGCGRSQGKVN